MLYLKVSDKVVNSMLTQVEGNKNITQSIMLAKYWDKLIIALVVSIQKLKPYFQCHTVK